MDAMRALESAGGIENKGNANLKIMRKFLRWLDADAAEFDFRCIWPKEKVLPNGWSRVIKYRGDPHDERLARKLGMANRDGYGVFVTVNETNGAGVKAEHVIRVRAVWADWDDGVPNDTPLEPSFVISTSPGKFQAYWLLRDEMSFADFSNVMECIVSNYGGDKNAKDLARVLRVPGFFHTKGDPFLCRIDSYDADGEGDYTAKRIIRAFPPVSSNKPGTSGKAEAQALFESREFDPTLVRKALKFIPADDYENYFLVVAAIKRGSDLSDEGREIAKEWASQSEKFDATEFDRRWARGKEGEGADKYSMGTVYKLAKENGFEFPKVHPLAKFVGEANVATSEHHEETALEFGLRQKEWTEEKLQKLLTRMNAQHGVVPVGGKVRYLHRTTGRSGKPDLQFLAAEDMKRLYAAVIVDGRRQTAFDAWEKWPGRNQYAGVGFFPGSPVNPPTVPKGYLNLWKGFAITPREGKWGRFRKHLREVVCAGNIENFGWLMDWLADLVQNPQKKPGSAVVLKSEQKGSGKSMLVEFLKTIFGSHGQSASQIDHIVGKFNAHLEEAVFFGVEEGFWAGHKQANSTLKTLITQPTIGIERKGLDYYQAPNYTRLLFTSNENWVVPVGTEERRYFVLEFENERANDREYFDPIFEQMENGGLEAMLHDLLARGIASNLRFPPTTEGLLNQRTETLEGPQRWLHIFAQDGEIEVEIEVDGRRKTRNYTLSDEGSTSISTRHVVVSAKPYCDKYEARGLETRLGALLAKVGVEKKRRRQGGERSSRYIFPPLSEFRQAVGKVLGVPLQDD